MAEAAPTIMSKSSSILVCTYNVIVLRALASFFCQGGGGYRGQVSIRRGCARSQIVREQVEIYGTGNGREEFAGGEAAS